MLLAHKIELRPTPEQAVYLDKACGSKRHCFNQLLAYFSKPENKWSKAEAYQYYIKVIRKEFEWYNEVSSRVTRNAIDDLDNAFKHFCECGFSADRDLNAALNLNKYGRDTLQLDLTKTHIRAVSAFRFIQSICADGVNKPNRKA